MAGVAVVGGRIGGGVPQAVAPHISTKGSLFGYVERAACYVASCAVTPSASSNHFVANKLFAYQANQKVVQLVQLMGTNPEKAFQMAQDPSINLNTIVDGKTLFEHAYEKHELKLAAYFLKRGGAAVSAHAEEKMTDMLAWRDGNGGEAWALKEEMVTSLLEGGFNFSPQAVAQIVKAFAAARNMEFLRNFLANENVVFPANQSREMLESFFKDSPLTPTEKAELVKILIVKDVTITGDMLKEYEILDEMSALYLEALKSTSMIDQAFCRQISQAHLFELQAGSKETLLEKLLPGDLKYALPDNWLRDFTWTGLAAGNVSLGGKVMPAINGAASLSTQLKSAAFTQPMVTQWLYSTIPMMLLAIYQTRQASQKGELTKEAMVKIWAPVAAASLAIPMWNMGQTIGTALGANAFPHSKLWFGSSIAGGMIAAPFTGILEGFTQWAVRYLVDVATNPVTREMWRQNPVLMTKTLTKELLLNVTIGAIPGAVWQIVWFFVLASLMASNPFGWAVILTMLAVATAVMICNFACTHAINKASEKIDKYFGWDKELEQLRKDAEAALALANKAHDERMDTAELNPAIAS